jgi:two-component system sensor histidine kinase/response regulator
VEKVRVAALPRYDVVLMDLQMPEMDGYQATAAIRADPRSARLPIVAMTAHALAEERRRCVEAGMSGHITKPIDPEVLFQTLLSYCAQRHAARAPAADHVPDAREPIPAIPGLDTVAGLHRVRGNTRLYRSLLLQFAEQQAGVLESVPSSLERGDLEGARRAIHTVKGVAANLGGAQLARSAAELEAALQREPAHALEAATAFHRDHAALARAIEAARSGARAAEGPRERLSAADATRALDELRTLILSDDAAAADLFLELKSRLTERLAPEDLAAMESRLVAYDYAEALERVEAALGALRASEERA